MHIVYEFLKSNTSVGNLRKPNELMKYVPSIFSTAALPSTAAWLYLHSHRRFRIDFPTKVKVKADVIKWQILAHLLDLKTFFFTNHRLLSAIEVTNKLKELMQILRTCRTGLIMQGISFEIKKKKAHQLKCVVRSVTTADKVITRLDSTTLNAGVNCVLKWALIYLQLQRVSFCFSYTNCT